MQPQPLTKEKIEFSQPSGEHSVKVEDVRSAVEWLKEECIKLNNEGYLNIITFNDIIEEAFEGVLR